MENQANIPIGLKFNVHALYELGSGLPKSPVGSRGSTLYGSQWATIS